VGRVRDHTGLVLLARAPLMKVALAVDIATPKPRTRNPATMPKRDQVIVGKNCNIQSEVDEQMTEMGYKQGAHLCMSHLWR
jgi:hypothetical protein